MAFSYSDYSQMTGSTQQLLANLGGIVVAGTLTLLVQRALWNAMRRRATGNGGRQVTGHS